MIECMPGTDKGLGSVSSITKDRKKKPTTVIFLLSLPGSMDLFPILIYAPITEKSFGTSVKLGVNHDSLNPKGAKIQLPIPECYV